MSFFKNEKQIRIASGVSPSPKNASHFSTLPQGEGKKIRLDKWLWHARFHKTRGLAQDACASGLIRLNGRRIEKASVEVKPGDLLTIPRGREIVVVRVVACGIRRGPAREAALLYEILDESVLDPGRPRP